MVTAAQKAKKLRDNKPVPESKVKGSHMLSMVTRVGKLKRKKDAALDIVTIGPTTVHSHKAPEVFDADGKKIYDRVGYGQVSRINWSGALMGDNIERKFGNIVQKVVETVIITAPEGEGDGIADVVEKVVTKDNEGEEKSTVRVESGGEEK